MLVRLAIGGIPGSGAFADVRTFKCACGTADGVDGAVAVALTMGVGVTRPTTAALSSSSPHADRTATPTAATTTARLPNPRIREVVINDDVIAISKRAAFPLPESPRR